MEPNEIKPGTILYIPSSFYIDHGEDDVQGGKAIVMKVRKSDYLKEESYNYYEVTFRGIHTGTLWYNLKYLLENQEKWKEDYGDQLAYEDPDFH